MSPGGVQIIHIPIILDHQAIIARGHQNTRRLITVLTTLWAKPSPPSARTKLPCREPLTILLKRSWYWNLGAEQHRKPGRPEEKAASHLA